MVMTMQVELGLMDTSPVIRPTSSLNSSLSSLNFWLLSACSQNAGWEGLCWFGISLHFTQAALQYPHAMRT